MQIDNCLRTSSDLRLCDFIVPKTAEGKYAGDPFLWPSLSLATDSGPDCVCLLAVPLAKVGGQCGCHAPRQLFSIFGPIGQICWDHAAPSTHPCPIIRPIAHQTLECVFRPSPDSCRRKCEAHDVSSPRSVRLLCCCSWLRLCCCFDMIPVVCSLRSPRWQRTTSSCTIAAATWTGRTILLTGSTTRPREL